VPQAEGDRTINGDRLTDRAIALLSKPENVATRFYLWVHYVDVHAAYVPHPEFDFCTKSRDLYDGEVKFVDHHVGRLLSAIQASPFAPRTAIVVTSDHGEAFGEHGMVRHGRELWEELVHVRSSSTAWRPCPPSVRRARSTWFRRCSIYGPRPAGTAPTLSRQSMFPDVVLPRPRRRARRSLVDMSEARTTTNRQASSTAPQAHPTKGRPLGRTI
jgi:hypothetical protein